MTSRTVVIGGRYLAALVLGLLAAFAIVAWQGIDPARFTTILGDSTIGSLNAAFNTIRWATPVMLAALAYLIAARTGVFNLGVEGQAYVGGLAAALVASSLPGPGVVRIVAAMLAAAVAGASYAAPAAWLARRWQVNEIVVTLMLNYVAVLMTTLIVRTWFLQHSNGVVSETIATARLDSAARFGYLGPQTSATWAIAPVVVLCLAAAVVLHRTWLGTTWDTVGQSTRFASFSGVRSGTSQFAAFLTSGAIGGLVGAVEVLGAQGRFVSSFLGSFAFDGILAAIIGGLHPIGVMVSSLFYGALTNTSYVLAATTEITSYLVMLILAVFVILFNIDPLRALLARRRS